MATAADRLDFLRRYTHQPGRVPSPQVPSPFDQSIKGLLAQPEGPPQPPPPSKLDALTPASMPDMAAPQAPYPTFKVVGQRPAPLDVPQSSWDQQENDDNARVNAEENAPDIAQWKQQSALYSMLTGKKADMAAAQQNARFGDQAKLAGSFDQQWQDAALKGSDPQQEAHHADMKELASLLSPLEQTKLRNEGDLGVTQQQGMNAIGAVRETGAQNRLTRAAALAQMLGGNAASKPVDKFMPSDTPQPTTPNVPWRNYLTGIGAPPGTSLWNQMDARNERLKYDKTGGNTDLTEPIQESELGNLQAISGLFPGLRGIQGLLPTFREHQAKMGHEVPAATLSRLQGMEAMLREDYDNIDSQPKVKFDPNGNPLQATDPQMTQRSKATILGVVKKLQRAQQGMIQHWPELAGSGMHPPIQSSSTWERLPD